MTAYVKTHLRLVLVQLTDLLSFPLHFQQQPLLHPPKFLSFLFKHTILHLPHQLIMLPATHTQKHTEKNPQSTFDNRRL